jgi:hypothetical protein
MGDGNNQCFHGLPSHSIIGKKTAFTANTYVLITSLLSIAFVLYVDLLVSYVIGIAYALVILLSSIKVDKELLTNPRYAAVFSFGSQSGRYKIDLCVCLIRLM